MKINMTELQFNKFTELCKKSKNELSGIMKTQITNGNIFIVDINLDENDVIKSASSNKITYDVKEYLTKTIYDLAFTNSPVYIRFHTHPSFYGSPGLSKADTNNLKYVQSLTKKVTKINSDKCTKVIEGIITRSEIAFYTYDLETDKIIRIPLFVDGVEKIPSTEKSKFQIFKESFLEGRSKVKRK